MLRTLASAALMFGLLVQPASSQITEEQRALARLFAGTNYFLRKAEPDKARRYAQSMYLMLRDKELEHGASYADELFYQVTGINGSRTAYFRSMEIIDRDGSLSSIPREQEKKSYTCRKQYDDSVSCSED